MASALLSAQLGTTPPQYSTSRSTPRRQLSGNVVAFRGSTTSDDIAGSVGQTPSSLADINSWRSMSRSSRDTTDSNRLLHNRSIPKSASFVKVEGFNTAVATPVASPPESPGREALGKASSLLSRQLSIDNVAALHSHNTVGYPSSLPSSLAGSASSGDTSTVVQRLEERCSIKLEPVPRPASLPRRPSIPDDLLEQLQSRYPVFKEPLVVRAFNISRLAHDGRYDGANREPAFARCASSAALLAELGADETALSAALLHDVLDRTMLLEGQLRQMLGSDEVIALVKKVSHVGYVCAKFLTSPGPSPTAQANEINPASGLVDMLVAHLPPRALLVRLAVTLQEARSLDARTLFPNAPLVSTPRSAADRQRIARDALAVWAPLANRLGVWALKAELEDRAFRVLHPTEHASLQERLEEAQSPTRLVALADRLRSELQAQGIEYIDLSGRPKHLWGVWCKMQSKGYAADEVADVRGLRVIVKSREDCYKAMRVVETVWQLAGPSKNYIKNPKPNGYQSLHAIAEAGDGHLVEVQIRTDKMHYLAEYGAQAAHWRYKEKRSSEDGSSSAPSSAPSAAAPTNTAGGGGHLAQEINWAKFVTSRSVASDKKCRPSGSPNQDQSLESILASIDIASSSPGSSPPSNITTATTTTRQSRSFVEYLAVSGQSPAPPQEHRVRVAVVVDGICSVLDLAAGTTLRTMLEQCGTSPHRVQVIINRCIESSLDAKLHPGDMIELYPEPATVIAAPRPVMRSSSGISGSGSMQGNVMSLGKLKKPTVAAGGM